MVERLKIIVQRYKYPSKSLLFLLGMLFFYQSAYAQKMSPEEVVQKQLEAYNSRDIDKFMEVIDQDIAFYNYADGKQTMQGGQACKEFYSALFEASPKLHSTILTRTVFGNKVIDHEHITGRNGSNELIELVLIFEIQAEKIKKITVLRKEE